MRLLLGAGWLLAAGCGRFGFEPGDVPQPGDPETQVLPCGEPVRFPIGAGSLTALTATPTPTGFAVFTVGDTSLSGSSYDWQGEAFAATVERGPVGNQTRDVVGAVAVGSDIVVASVYGATGPSGTVLYPLSETMMMRGPAQPRGEIGGARPIATTGTGDQLALITIDPTTSQVDARRVTVLGDDAGPAVKLVDPARDASTVSIEPSGTGYLATWTERAPTPNASRIALLDESFGVVAGPVTTNSSTFDPINAHAVWASSTDRYLVTWYEKRAGGGDDTWFQILGPRLEPITAPAILARDAARPEIASDGTSFWVTWIDKRSNPERLAGAQVSADGAITARPVTHSGGTPRQWTMVSRAGQSVLVWTEVGGSGADLYFDPMCR